MVKDYKSSQGKTGGKAHRPMMHPFSIGIIIGFVLGMGVALGFAIYINHSSLPFVEKELPASRKELKPLEGSKSERQAKAEKSAKAAAEAPKTKFEFYDILPGKQEAMPAKPDEGKQLKEHIYLQAGSFQTSAEADNLKARLALAGFESQIKTAQLPDNKTWHRVRLGPYASAEEAQRVQSDLQSNDIKASLIRARE